MVFDGAQSSMAWCPAPPKAPSSGSTHPAPAADVFVKTRKTQKKDVRSTLKRLAHLFLTEDVTKKWR